MGTGSVYSAVAVREIVTWFRPMARRKKVLNDLVIVTSRRRESPTSAAGVTVAPVAVA